MPRKLPNVGGQTSSLLSSRCLAQSYYIQCVGKCTGKIRKQKINGNYISPKCILLCLPNNTWQSCRRKGQGIRRIISLWWCIGHRKIFSLQWNGRWSGMNQKNTGGHTESNGTTEKLLTGHALNTRSYYGSYVQIKKDLDRDEKGDHSHS